MNELSLIKQSNKPKKPNYFKYFFKSGYLLHTLAIGALICTLIAIGYELEIWQKVSTHKELLFYTFCVLGLFTLASALAIAFTRKKANINVNDALPFAFVIASIFMAIYLYLEVENFTLFGMLVALNLFLFGDFGILCNALAFDPDYQDDGVIYASTTLKAFYKTIFKKYPSFYILALSAVTTCFTTILFHPAYSFNFTTEQYCAIAILLIPVIAYASYNVARKTVIALDAVLVASLLVFPLSLLEILLFNVNRMENLFIWACALMIAIIYTFVRYKSFDIKAQPPKDDIQKKSAIGYYFKSIARKYDLLLAFALGAVLTFSGVVAFPPILLNQLISFKDGLALNPTVFLVVIIQAATFGTVLFCIFLTFVNVSIKKVNLGDFLLVAVTSFSVFTLATLAIEFSFLKAVGAGAGLIICLIILVARIHAIYKHD